MTEKTQCNLLLHMQQKVVAVAANPFPRLARNLGHNAAGVVSISERAPKVAPKAFGASPIRTQPILRVQERGEFPRIQL